MVKKSKKQLAGMMGASLVLFVGLFNLNADPASANDGTSEYSGAPGARASFGGVNGTELFLGGNYIELGISNWGDFGTEGNKPGDFRGTFNGEIIPYLGSHRVGMSTDYDGYNNGRDLPIDFYLPGTPEERFAVGYQAGGSTFINSNSALMGSKSMATTVSDASVVSEGLLKANILSTWSGRMEISQSVSFKVNDKFYRNEVTIKNLTNQTWNSARYMRSMDPDNTVFRGGSSATANTVTHTFAEDGKSVVKAETYGNFDPMYVATGSRMPFFFYSKDPAAKASVFGFSNNNPYIGSAYDNPRAKGSTLMSDAGITLTWDSGELAPGESKSFVYYSSLDERDFEEVVEEIEETKYPVNFSVIETDGEANGTLTAAVDAEVINSADEIVEGKNVVLTATPAEGYHIKEWTLNDTVVEVEGEPYTGNVFTVENLLKSENVTVEFERSDSEPPVTEDGAPAAWQNQDVTIALTASDAGSGVESTYYQVNGGEQQTGTTVHITTEGTHTLTYWSVDAAGNMEAKNSTTIHIDKTKPTTVDNAPATWQKQDVTITLTASDAGSGVESTYYQVNGGEPQTGTTVQITTEGTHTLTYWSVDAAGNIEEKNNTTINIDKTKPTTMDNAPATWQKQDVTITLTASDAGSGVESTYYQVNGGEPQTGTTVQITTEGTHTLTYWSVDAAGNIEEKNNTTINIDKTKPTTMDNAPATWQKQDVTITLTASDAGSGVESTYYQINGGEPQTGTTVQITEEGTHTLTYWCVDAAGNIEEKNNATINIDKTKPTTFDNAPATWQKQDVTITLTASDSGSGVESTYYQVNGGEPQTGTTVHISTEGTHTLTYWSVDAAGNIEAKNSTTINIDKTAPTLKMTPNISTLWSPNNKLVDIHIVIDAEGGLSGMNSVVLTSITSNEANSENDIQGAEFGTYDTNFKLRAKREGNGTGRIYTITYTVTDRAGNVTVGTVTIDVPHDKRK